MPETLVSSINSAKKKLPRKERPDALRPTWEKRVTQQMLRMAQELHQYTTFDAQSLCDAFLASIDADYVSQVTRMVETYTNLLKSKPSLAWKHIGSSKRRQQAVASMPAVSQVARMKAFYDHFSRLFAPKETPDDLQLPQFPRVPPISGGPFTDSELAVALSFASSGRATGTDGIPNEVWKLPEIRSTVLDILNEALTNGIPAFLLFSQTIKRQKHTLSSI